MVEFILIIIGFGKVNLCIRCQASKFSVCWAWTVMYLWLLLTAMQSNENLLKRDGHKLRSVLARSTNAPSNPLPRRWSVQDLCTREHKDSCSWSLNPRDCFMTSNVNAPNQFSFLSDETFLFLTFIQIENFKSFGNKLKGRKCSRNFSFLNNFYDFA